MRSKSKKAVAVTATSPEDNLLIAAVRGDCAAIERMLSARQAPDVNTRQQCSGCTPILRASAMGHDDAVRILIGRGALLDATDLRTGRTSLHEAAARGYLAVVRRLLESGCDPSAQDQGGKVAYDLVVLSACPTRTPECGNAECELHSARAQIKELLEDYL